MDITPGDDTALNRTAAWSDVAPVRGKLTAEPSTSTGTPREPRASPWTFDAPTPGRRKVLELARRAARSSCPILLLGPTGVGKEVLANDIHRHSRSCSGPFVAVNCAALTPSLFESQLFGHTRGAFTGATADRPGFVDLAHGGTLFLDEVGELSTEAQAKLLRFLAQGTYWPVGAASDRRSDVRILAATHRRIDEAAGTGTVREDFFFRLSVVVLRIPPLVAEDSRAIARTVARTVMARQGAPVVPADVETLATLCAARTWRGGARELSNAIERVLALRDPAQPLADAWEELLAGEPGRACGSAPLASPAPVPSGPLQPVLPASRASLIKLVDSLFFLGVARECRDVRDLAERAGLTLQAVYGRLRRLHLRPEDVGSTPRLTEVMERLRGQVEPELPWIRSILAG